MTGLCVYKNQYVSFTFSIVLQISVIFLFLIIFFFSYVQKVENKSFDSQIQYTVDNIMSDIGGEVSKIIYPPNITAEQKDMLRSTYSCIIDYEKNKIIKDNKQADKDIQNSNNNITRFAINILIGVIAISILISLSFSVIKFCLPFMDTVKETIIGIIFIGLTEFLFLDIAASKYITADPNLVKNIFATTCKKYAECVEKGKNYPC